MPNPGGAKRCEHNLVICSRCVVVTDAAKRMSEAIGLAIVFNPPDVTKRGWMAFALADGNTDHVVYPTKQAAIDHQSNEFLYAYLCLQNVLGGIPVKDAQIWLDLHRHVYDSGGRLTDPDTSLIMPLGREQRITRL